MKDMRSDEVQIDFRYKPELGFIARSFVMASLPYKSIDGNIYTRQNGNFSLSLVTAYKLPYGVIPRLLLCFLTSEATKNKSKVIVLGNSLADFMRNLGFSNFTGGRWGSITRLKDAVKRLFSCMVTVKWENKDTTHIKNILPVAQTSIYNWWNPCQSEQKLLWESTVTLTEEFYNEIITVPVPFNIVTLSMLRTAPMAIDQYLWISYRNSYIRHKTLIKWESLAAQFGSSTSDTTSRGLLDFKKIFVKALKKCFSVSFS
jgi:hypothetical protein